MIKTTVPYFKSTYSASYLNIGDQPILPKNSTTYQETIYMLCFLHYHLYIEKACVSKGLEIELYPSGFLFLIRCTSSIDSGSGWLRVSGKKLTRTRTERARNTNKALGSGTHTDFWRNTNILELQTIDFFPSLVINVNKYDNPADTWRKNNAIMTSKRRFDVVSTS